MCSMTSKLRSTKSPPTRVTVDVERIWLLAERVEFLKLRAVGRYDSSCDWAAAGFVSTASALRSKTRCTPGAAHRAVRLARKLDQLPETAAAFAAGAITREHAAVIAAPYTPERAEMLDGIEKELVDFARIGTPIELRDVVKRYTDAFDGDDGAGEDAKQQKLNKMTVSPTLGGRGILNGSFDPEVTDLIQTALDAEMESLRNSGETRDTPALRAEAFESICRQYLAGRYDTGARGRGQTHVSAVWDISQHRGHPPRTRRRRPAPTAPTGNDSPAAPSNGSPATATSAASSPTGPATSSTSAAPPAPSTPACGPRSSPATNTAENPAAIAHPASVKHITYGTGNTADPPTSTTSNSCCWFHHKQQHIRDAQTGAGQHPPAFTSGVWSSG